MKNIVLKILLVVFISSAFTSCKKQYSCSCVVTVSEPTYNIIYRSTPKKISAKLTKKQAKSVCDHESENVNTTVTNYDTYNGNWSTNATYHTDCVLEE